MSELRRCNICETTLDPHGHYIVRMDVFADPSMPESDAEQGKPGETIPELIKQMKHLSAEELQDQVHRRFEFVLCPKCHRAFLSNPLGKPRGAKGAGKN